VTEFHNYFEDNVLAVCSTCHVYKDMDILSSRLTFYSHQPRFSQIIIGSLGIGLNMYHNLCVIDCISNIHKLLTLIFFAAVHICSLMNEVVHTSPTIGSNVEEVVWKNIHFIMWDIGGQESLRATWNTYYTNTKVSVTMVFVIVTCKEYQLYLLLSLMAELYSDHKQV